ncbi:TPA: hypothetical protein ACKQGS_005621 [Pseudomonas aeruginosa]|nr:hypothetical protein [Pseudomonas aeruginosa]
MLVDLQEHSHGGKRLLVSIAAPKRLHCQQLLDVQKRKARLDAGLLGGIKFVELDSEHDSQQLFGECWRVRLRISIDPHIDTQRNDRHSWISGQNAEIRLTVKQKAIY